MRIRAALLLIGMLVALTGTSILFAADPQTATLQQEPEPTVNPFPRPTEFDMVVAEQTFANGRMFYLQPADRIWVMVYDDPNERDSGSWAAFVDEWTEDDPEFDPTIRPPDGLHQPIRGFGLLWRENEDIRAALGWGLDPEFGHVTRYTFEAGGFEVDEDNVISEVPGIHTLVSGYGGVYTFDEADGTWELDSESLEAPAANATPAASD